MNKKIIIGIVVAITILVIVAGISVFVVLNQTKTNPEEMKIL